LLDFLSKERSQLSDLESLLFDRTIPFDQKTSERGVEPAVPKRHGGPPHRIGQRRKSWPDKLGQLDKWSFCLTTAKMAVEQERR
jgi:hypothetical protein